MKRNKNRLSIRHLQSSRTVRQVNDVPSLTGGKEDTEEEEKEEEEEEEDDDEDEDEYED